MAILPPTRDLPAAGRLVIMIYFVYHSIISIIYYSTSLPAAGRSLVGGRIANKNVKPYKKVNSLVALKFHPEVLSFDFSCVTKFILEIE